MTLAESSLPAAWLAEYGSGASTAEAAGAVAPMNAPERATTAITVASVFLTWLLRSLPAVLLAIMPTLPPAAVARARPLDRPERLPTACSRARASIHWSASRALMSMWAVW